MTTRLDTKLVPRTLEIINRLGKTVDFRYSELSSHSSGEQNLINQRTYEVKVTPPTGPDDRLIGSDGISTSDQQIYVPASGLPSVPHPGHEFVIDGIRRVVISSEPIYTGDEVALYLVILRK